MAPTTWIVQTNVEPESTSPAALKVACATEGLPFHEIAVLPGAPELPPLPEVKGPVVFHGRTTLILRALEHPRWRQGIFFDPSRFQHRAYATAWGSRLLNAGAEILSWEALLAERRNPDQEIFIKPNDDLKRFTGQVLRFSDCSDLYRALRSSPRPLDPTSEVVVAQPCEIDGEWRLFVVDGQVVTGSMYRPSGEPYLPRELVAFAEEALAEWVPAPVFVLDVARVDGTWKIIECNCFNGSRFYAADVKLLVQRVSERQASAFTS